MKIQLLAVGSLMLACIVLAASYRSHPARPDDPTSARLDGVRRSSATLLASLADLRSRISLAGDNTSHVTRESSVPISVLCESLARRLRVVEEIASQTNVRLSAVLRLPANTPQSQIRLMGDYQQNRALDRMLSAQERAEALSVLRGLDGAEYRSPAVCAAMADLLRIEPDEQLRRRIARDLTRIATDDMKSLWCTILVTDPSRFVREEAARNLLYFVVDNPDVAQILTSVAQTDASQQVRTACTVSLQGNHHPLLRDR